MDQPLKRRRVSRDDEISAESPRLVDNRQPSPGEDGVVPLDLGTSYGAASFLTNRLNSLPERSRSGNGKLSTPRPQLSVRKRNRGPSTEIASVAQIIVHGGKESLKTLLAPAASKIVSLEGLGLVTLSAIPAAPSSGFTPSNQSTNEHQQLTSFPRTAVSQPTGSPSESYDATGPVASRTRTEAFSASSKPMSINLEGLSSQIVFSSLTPPPPSPSDLSTDTSFFVAVSSTGSSPTDTQLSPSTTSSPPVPKPRITVVTTAGNFTTTSKVVPITFERRG